MILATSSCLVYSVVDKTFVNRTPKRIYSHAYSMEWYTTMEFIPVSYNKLTNEYKTKGGNSIFLYFSKDVESFRCIEVVDDLVTRDEILAAKDHLLTRNEIRLE
eukprot:GHVR01138942.1.p1 GENE.GHVR01138942.1~~GHVR01138942.1.p1  ORF type:complete len:104 (+),score=7.83 GHVR01138942.1:720-1031(+)